MTMKTETGLVRINFNTKRSYSEHGQRIAAQKVGGDVLMVDVDRMIEYWIPNCPLEQSAIMARYDANDRCQNIPANAQYRDIVKSLEKFATSAPVLKTAEDFALNYVEGRSFSDGSTCIGTDDTKLCVAFGPSVPHNQNMLLILEHRDAQTLYALLTSALKAKGLLV